MKKLLLALIPLLMLSGCGNTTHEGELKTAKEWCLIVAKEEFSFDSDGESGIFFIREADEYVFNDATSPDIPPYVYVYLIDVAHDGGIEMVISEYVAWIEASFVTYERKTSWVKYAIYESDILDIGCELIERL